MAAGVPPSRRKTSEEIVNAILTESPVKPSAINPAIPARLDTVILRALEKDRRVRYQSIENLLADLEEWQRLEARAATLKTRRWMLATAGAGVAALAGGGYLARRALFPQDRRIL